MCGRYVNFSADESREMEQILREISKRYPDRQPKTGEIYPSDLAPVLIARDGGVAPDMLTWGFPGFDKGKLIINARSETVQEKRMFREGFISRRCVIPSAGFYEWNREKQKFLFQKPGGGMLYMAGIYEKFQGSGRYVILTAQANASVLGVHHRMPVILEENALQAWTTDQQAAANILQGQRPLLERQAVGNRPEAGERMVV